MKVYDLIIIGSGPAGSAAAKLASSKGMSVLVIERGKNLEKRRDLMAGWFGSGIYSVNRLEIEDHLLASKKSIREVIRLIKGVSSKKIYITKGKVKYYRMHDEFGSELAQYFFDSIVKRADIAFGEEVVSINQKEGIFYVKTENQEFQSSKCLIATGKHSMDWVKGVCDNFGIDAKKSSIKIGVRIEVPTFKVKEMVCDTDDITFEDGKVKTVDARIDSFVGEWEESGIISTMGHGMPGKESRKTNFVICRETTDVNRAICDSKIVNVLSNDKIKVEKVKDYMIGRSQLKHIKAFSNMEGILSKIDSDLPGFAQSALMYSPEIRLRGILPVDSNMKTTVDGLYGAGECTSRVSNMMGALASGIIAAKTILEE